MTLGTAVLLLAVTVAGFILNWKYLRKKRILCIVCTVFLALAALALIGYIGLTMVFVDAVQNRPPIVG